MTLELYAKVAARDLDLALRLEDGERIAILGPNGAGKSTTLSVLAGLLRPDEGRAELDGRVLFDVGTPGTGSWVPPHARGIALMAQEPLLFPHLSVLENVAFGPRSAGGRARAARETARHWLDQVGAPELADRRPAGLSGGQAQRVAIARALAADPALLLLDEPMAALDVGAAPVLRQVLRRVLADRAAIIVTHEVLDAFVLADRVVVVDGGRVVESGATADVLARPRSPFTARIAGLNMVSGTAVEHGLRRDDGQLIEGIAALPAERGAQAVAVFRPRSVAVFRVRPDGSPRNVLPVTISALEPRDEQVRVRAGDLSADVTAAAVADLDLAPGATVYFSIKASEVDVYPL